MSPHAAALRHATAEALMPDTEDSPLPPHREDARTSSSLAASPPVAETLDSLLDLFTPPAVDRLAWPLADEAGVIVECLRADTLDSEISGNKAWKLRLPLARALSEKRGIISCGGGWSNHLHALAAAGARLGIETHGLVRGHPEAPLTPTLADARDNGMRLSFVSRAEYRQRDQPDFARRHGEGVWIPEGGGCVEGVAGLAPLAQALAEPVPGESVPQLVLLACGSGTTLAGVLSALGERDGLRVIGVPTMNHGDQLYHRVRRLLAESGGSQQKTPEWGLWLGAQAGGFAKAPDWLIQFIQRFEAETGVAVEPVYTAKLFAALAHHLANGLIARGTRIRVLHSGGLQGRRGYPALQAI
ncbi:1-aminocyclopropane-1-carboxylate deaminase/D-cysteine desulfhydrase [Cobetia amphilecti]|uniref:Pyridoxal-phosphate dependent enzyme n=1 Tax=Cobetia amphilecti TaxID=1055104 RepID=A0ABT6UP21_9GAMM|nr:pyridoxal-phosphate dependent enzyme [Cobetia amphilecti]MDI5884452.1 pyridoxal-phosphate dependent enzyme [Cobetia amphilecti]